jgi:hypothetical protein
MKTRRRFAPRTIAAWTTGTLVVAAATLGSYSAQAYSDLLLFGLHPSEPGGGGRYFTGSIRDGFTCEVCHVASVESAAATDLVEIEGLPLEGFKAGETYEITFNYPSNAETIVAVAEFVDASGSAIGKVEPAERSAGTRAEISPAEIYETEDERTIFGLSNFGTDGFKATWKAPKDAGYAAFHAAIVIADGSGDPEGDRVQVVHHELLAQGSARQLSTRAMAMSSSNAQNPADTDHFDGIFNCSLNPDATAPSGLALLAGLFALRRRRWAIRASALLATCCLGGCVKPHERGRLAAPDMAFDGNGDLLAGQRHGTDYREGSSGGFGGGGGGCGCN